MEKETKNGLENFFSYRLINVFYMTSLIFLILCMLVAGFICIPKQRIRNFDSYILCKNGESYSFNQAGIALYEETYPWQRDIKALEAKEDEQARRTCMGMNKVPGEDQLAFKIIKITGIGFAQVPANMSDQEIGDFILNKYGDASLNKDPFSDIPRARAQQEKNVKAQDPMDLFQQKGIDPNSNFDPAKYGGVEITDPKELVKYSKNAPKNDQLFQNVKIIEVDSYDPLQLRQFEKNPLYLSGQEESAKPIFGEFDKIKKIKQEFPQYSDMSDQQLADALYNKYYSDLSKDEYYKKIGAKEFDSTANPAYKVSFSIEKTGSWLAVLGFWIGGSLLVYSILNVVKETLVYLFLGRRFGWSWLRKPSGAIVRKFHKLK